MKLLPGTGFAKLSTHKDAVRYAARKSASGHKVNIAQERDGKYKVTFEPKRK